MKRQTVLSYILLIIGALLISSCGIIRSLDDIVTTSSGREGKLATTTRVFNELLFWNKVDDASAFVAPEFRRTFAREFAQKVGKEKIVDQNVIGVEFYDNTNKADVEVVVRYFEIPSYVVNTRHEKQVWKYFRLGGGWNLSGFEDDSSNSKEEIAPPSTVESTSLDPDFDATSGNAE